MGIINCASSNSCYRGLDYYEQKRVSKIKKISATEYQSTVSGSDNYNVFLDISHPRRSTCNCPLANGKRIICKHIVATYFSVVPNSAKDFIEEQDRLQEEYEEYQNQEYKNVIKCLDKMTKEELIQELISVFDYGPEWLYGDFVRRNL